MARLAYLGPAIVVVGAMVAGAGAWYVLHARPTPGAVIDTIDLGSGGSLVLRSEAKGERAFLELNDREGVRWRALVPQYAGTHDRRGVAWGPVAVTVRVERGGRSEIFALAMRDGHKLGGRRLAPEHEPNTAPQTGPITLTDHTLSYEFVSGTNWHRVVGIDLAAGNVAWTAELGSAPVTAGGIDNGRLWITQLGKTRTFAATTGQEVTQPPTTALTTGAL